MKYTNPDNGLRPEVNKAFDEIEGLPTTQQFVVVYGPPASGKSLNQEALMKHYRCDVVWNGDIQDLKKALKHQRILVLTQSIDGLRYRGRPIPEDFLLVPVEQAALALGDKWRDPAKL